MQNASAVARAALAGAFFMIQLPVIAATCTVPNNISNGQPADATKLMDNFNAVANCAQFGVTTTGTPTTGSIAVFSNAGTITTGNLSGDVTTSGSTATTLSNTGVIANAYINPTITVDAKGRITSAVSNTLGVAGEATPAPWQQISLSTTSVSAFGGTAYPSTAPIVIAAGKQLEVEVYATKLTTQDIILFLSTNGTSAYAIAAQGDGNLVNYRYTPSQAALNASGTGGNGQNWNGLFRIKMSILPISSSQNVIWSVVNDQRVGGTGVITDGNINLTGNVTIYVKAASLSNIVFVRARVIG